LVEIEVRTGADSTDPEQEVSNPTSSETITSTGKATGKNERVFYDIRKLIELQKLF